ncbi:hypothetical protein RB597_006796 [Gaeumannomyces tritici]
MSQPQFQITSQETDQLKVAVNLLPCAVHHDGPVDPIQAYWRPTENDGKKTAYFRGRKLQGSTVKVPEGYKGVVVETSKGGASSEPQMADETEAINVDAAEKEPDASKMATKGEFEEVVVWNHEAPADASTDPYVRGIEEWTSLSEQVCSYNPSVKICPILLTAQNDRFIPTRE